MTVVGFRAADRGLYMVGGRDTGARDCGFNSCKTAMQRLTPLSRPPHYRPPSRHLKTPNPRPMFDDQTPLSLTLSLTITFWSTILILLTLVSINHPAVAFWALCAMSVLAAGWFLTTTCGKIILFFTVIFGLSKRSD